MDIAIVAAISALASSLITLAAKVMFDSRIERQKALLMRTTTLYQKRLDAIIDLYALLSDAQALYRQYTKPYSLAGEPSDKELWPLVWSASQKFATQQDRLKVLLPRDLAKQSDDLVQTFWELNLRIGQNTMLSDGDGHKRVFDEIQDIMTGKVPNLRASLEEICRTVLEPNRL